MKYGKRIESTDSVVDCHICNAQNDVSHKVEIIKNDNNHGNDWAGIHCKKCQTLITVVITIMGVNSIENLLKATNI